MRKGVSNDPQSPRNIRNIRNSLSVIRSFLPCLSYGPELCFIGVHTVRHPLELFLEVEKTTGYKPYELRGKQRNRELVNARSLYITLARKEGHKYTSIADDLNKHHTAIIYHVKKRGKNG